MKNGRWRTQRPFGLKSTLYTTPCPAIILFKSIPSTLYSMWSACTRCIPYHTQSIDVVSQFLHVLRSNPIKFRIGGDGNLSGCFQHPPIACSSIINWRTHRHRPIPPCRQKRRLPKECWKTVSTTRNQWLQFSRCTFCYSKGVSCRVFLLRKYRNAVDRRLIIFNLSRPRHSPSIV